MSKYLINTVETYRVDTEAEAAALIDEAKKDNRFDLLKYTTVKKDVKAKGEIIDTYYKVSLNKGFNEIKEPETYVEIEYNVD